MKKILFLLPVLSLLILSCEHPLSAELSREFKIKLGKEAYLENESLEIKFIAVTEDSRCPVDQNCKHPGNAKVILQIEKGFEKITDTLNTQSGLNQSILFRDYEIILVSLRPERISQQEIYPDNYEATLLVRKNDVVIKGGTSFGLCGGYCRTELVIKNGIVKFTGSSFDSENYPEIIITSSLSSSEWNELLSKVNIAALENLEEVYGCPDCVDGGAEWIEVNNNDFHKKITFEFGKTIHSINDLIEELRKIRKYFEEKLPE